MTMFFLLSKLVINAIVESEFLNERPCDCDVTDQCDMFCCCDTDCNSTTLESFKDIFCIPESKNPQFKIACNVANRIKRTNNIDTFYVNNIECYNVSITAGDEIKQFELTDLGVNISDSISAPYAPTIDITDRMILSNGTVAYNDTLWYIPFGLGSVYCNARILVRSGMEQISSLCLLDSSTLSSNTLNYSKIFGSPFDTYITLSTNSIDFLINSTTLTTRASTSNTLHVKMTGSYYDQSIPALAHGYTSGLPLVLNNATTTSVETNAFYFNDQIVYFGQSYSVVTNSRNISMNTSFCPTFGCSNSDEYHLNNTVPDNITGNFNAIFTLMFMKNGTSSNYTYIFVGVDSYYSPSTQAYNQFDLKQIELNNAGTEPAEQEASEPFSISFSDIFSFLFTSEERIIETLAILGAAVMAILAWMEFSIYN